MFIINASLEPKTCLVYSLLVRRFHRNKGCSARWLAANSGLDRSRTLKKVIAGLRQNRLVATNRRRLFPKRPVGEAADLFVWRKVKGEDWWKNFTFFRLHLPGKACPLSALHNFIHWKLLDLQRQGRTRQTHKGLATLLSVRRRTVSRAFVRLGELGLLTWEEEGKGVRFRLTKAPEEWFVAQTPKEKKPVDEPEGRSGGAKWRLANVPEGYNPEWWRSAYRGLIEKVMGEDPNCEWLQTEFPPLCYEVAAQLLHTSPDHYLRDAGWLARLYSDARRQHAKTGKAKTCAWLFLDMARSYIGSRGHDAYYRPVEPEDDLCEQAVRRVDEGKRRVHSY